MSNNHDSLAGWRVQAVPEAQSKDREWWVIATPGGDIHFIYAHEADKLELLNAVAAVPQSVEDKVKDLKAMARAFKLAQRRINKENSICWALDGLEDNNKITPRASHDCRALIRRALGGDMFLDEWVAKHDPDTYLRLEPEDFVRLRKRWVRKLINDIESEINRLQSA